MGSEKICSILYHGDACMGEVCIYPHNEEASLMDMIGTEIHISHFSCPSKRCSPLVVLHSIASTGFCFKMEPNGQQFQTDRLNLITLYNACLQEAKTAIVALGGNELHLVAMPSGNSQEQVPRFWGFNVVGGLYAACLGMLNLRCLAVVFDLDETLIVANTMRSFQDRIEALNRKILGEVDPKLVAGMSTEIKRYQDDQKVLKQFVESDHIYDHGKLIKANSEIVPAPSENHQPLVRPIIRLCEQRIVLTRIDPNNRDTSILVRIRPSWEELRNYLTANGRKRFEVFVCTMSEKNYALEMWRLLDPEASLISPKDLHNRVVCVKPGFRKFLQKVFHHGICHPKLAMVIDDRLNVWNDTDQSQVHVVPAFAPYSAPMAETSNGDPVLRIARNVVYSVRVGYFSDFDKGLFKRMARVLYETDVKKLPAVPDVSKYLVTENKEISNDNVYLPVPYGMGNSEVEDKLNLQDQNSLPNTGPACVLTGNQDAVSFMQPLQQAQANSTPPSSTYPQQCDKAIKHSHGISPADSSDSQAVGSEPINNDSPGREEGEISESEMDLNTKTWHLILKHGQAPGPDNHLQSNRNICNSKRPPPNKIRRPLHKKDFCGYGELKHKPGVNHTTKKSTCTDPDVSQFMKNYNHEKDEDQISREIKKSREFVEAPCGIDIQFASISAQATTIKQRTDNGKRSYNSVAAFKELCRKEGLRFQFQTQHTNVVQNVNDSHEKDEIAGKIFGEISSTTWQGAKLEAAEEALKNLKADSFNRQGQKRLPFTRKATGRPNKKCKQGNSINKPFYGNERREL